MIFLGVAFPWTGIEVTFEMGVPFAAFSLTTGTVLVFGSSRVGVAFISIPISFAKAGFDANVVMTGIDIVSIFLDASIDPVGFLDVDVYSNDFLDTDVDSIFIDTDVHSILVLVTVDSTLLDTDADSTLLDTDIDFMVAVFDGTLFAVLSISNWNCWSTTLSVEIY